MAGLHRPASKSDQAGKGVARLRRREHAQNDAGQAPCAACALRTRAMALERRHRFAHEAPGAKEIPLVPAGSGDGPLKEAAIAAGGNLGNFAQRPRGTPRSGRWPSGLQSLAGAGGTS